MKTLRETACQEFDGNVSYWNVFAAIDVVVREVWELIGLGICSDAKVNVWRKE